MYQTGKNSWLKHWDFILLDLLCMQIAYIAAFMLRHGWILPYSWEEYRNMGIIMALVELCAGFFLENYKDIVRRGYFQEFKKVLLLISTVIVIEFTYLFFTKSSSTFSRAVFIQMWLLGIGLTYCVRSLWKLYIRRKMKDKKYLDKMILVTTEGNVDQTLTLLKQIDYTDFYISGIILLDSTGEKKIGDIPVVAAAENAVEVLQNMIVDQVFIDGSRRNSYVREIMAACNEMGITTHYNLGSNYRFSGKSIVEDFAGHTVLTTSIKFADTRQLLLKRIMDILGGIVGIIFTAILTVILGPIIYIQSPGPIFFSQERVGKNGRKFRIYKFRSMYPDAEKRKKELMEKNKMQGFMFKMDNDPRVTPIGRFIRKTSLDEFPQFFNILKGDMSLVGTRPPTVDEYEQYERHHKVRLAAKPGLTGMWQVSGRSDIVDFEEVVALDKKYIEEWNIGLDLKILCQTVKVVVTGKGSV